MTGLVSEEEMLITVRFRFVEFEKWRKDTLLDALVPTWEYPERLAMAKYYPQFYHKVDKVLHPRASMPFFFCFAD